MVKSHFIYLNNTIFFKEVGSMQQHLCVSTKLERESQMVY